MCGQIYSFITQQRLMIELPYPWKEESHQPSQELRPFPVPVYMLSASIRSFISSLNQLDEPDIITVLIVQVRKLKHRQVKQLAKGHSASKQQSQYFWPESILLTALLDWPKAEEMPTGKRNLTGHLMCPYMMKIDNIKEIRDYLSNRNMRN